MKRANLYFISIVLFHIAFWMVVAMLCFGCSTTKRATHHFNKAYMLSRPVVASGCHDLYPVENKTEYVKGKDSIVYHNDTVDCDKVMHDTTTVNHTVIVKGRDVYHTDTVLKTVRDSAGMAVLYNRIDSMKDVITKRDVKIESVTKMRNVLWWVCGALFVVLALVVYAIIKQINLKQMLK